MRIDVRGWLQVRTQPSGEAGMQVRRTALERAGGTSRAPGTSLRAVKALLEELDPESPAVRQTRIAQLKQAIASGTYQPDSRRIAERILPG